MPEPRGTAAQRGYGSSHRRQFRAEVLRHDPICVLCRTAPSTVADHWPLSRRKLEAQGLNPNDPKHGRGLCKPCHDRETAKHQPGGWNKPRLRRPREAHPGLKARPQDVGGSTPNVRI